MHLFAWAAKASNDAGIWSEASLSLTTPRRVRGRSWTGKEGPEDARREKSEYEIGVEVGTRTVRGRMSPLAGQGRGLLPEGAERTVSFLESLRGEGS